MNTTATPRPTKPICTVCGSDDVKADAYATWDEKSLAWVLDQTFDDMHCEKCGGECSVDWVWIDPAARLYNCCTGHKAPDWSQFKSLETGGCINDPEDSGHTIGGKSDDEAEFFTVYARHHSGEAEAITDCNTREEVDQLAAELSALSNLPVKIN